MRDPVVERWAEVKTSAIDEWLLLANSVIEGEKVCYKSQVAARGVSRSNPVDSLRTLELSVDAMKATRGRNAALARLKDLTTKCKAEAHSGLKRSEFAEVSRDLDNVVTAIAELQRWDDIGEISIEAVNTLGRSFNPFNLAPVYRGRFQPRLEAVEAAIKSDALESFRFVSLRNENIRVGQTDTPKKSGKISKRRMLDGHGRACVKEFKDYLKRGDRQSMQYVVDEYVAEHPEVRKNSLYRSLTDNSDQWKPKAN